MNEMNKLVVILAKAGVEFEIGTFIVGGGSTFQICSPSKKNCKVDAISHKYSYGGPEGLIEVLGTADEVNAPNDDVMGWLTAEEAAKYFFKGKTE